MKCGVKHSRDGQVLDMFTVEGGKITHNIDGSESCTFHFPYELDIRGSDELTFTYFLED